MLIAQGHRKDKMMLPQDNARERAHAESSPSSIYLLPVKEHVEADQKHQVGPSSIDIYLDPRDPEALKTIETYVAAFGENYAKVEQVSDEAVVLRLYPGGAEELKR